MSHPSGRAFGGSLLVVATLAAGLAFGEEREDPLNGLRQRSASKRWEELRRRTLDRRRVTRRPRLGARPNVGRAALPRPSRDAEQLVPTPPANPTIDELESQTRDKAFPFEVREVDQIPHIRNLKTVTTQPDEPLRSPDDLRKITEISPFLSSAGDEPEGNKPDGVSELTMRNYESRALPERVFQWDASNVFANPLYFEDPSFERSGHTHYEYLQPFVSVARFSGQLVSLPYQAVLDPPTKKVYPLGHYRPGEWAPYLYTAPPWNFEGGLFQAEVLTGLIFLIP